MTEYPQDKPFRIGDDYFIMSKRNVPEYHFVFPNIIVAYATDKSPAQAAAASPKIAIFTRCEGKQPRKGFYFYKIDLERSRKASL